MAAERSTQPSAEANSGDGVTIHITEGTKRVLPALVLKYRDNLNVLPEDISDLTKCLVLGFREYLANMPRGTAEDPIVIDGDFDDNSDSDRNNDNSGDQENNIAGRNLWVLAKLVWDNRGRLDDSDGQENSISERIVQWLATIAWYNQGHLDALPHAVSDLTEFFVQDFREFVANMPEHDAEDLFVIESDLDDSSDSDRNNDASDDQGNWDEKKVVHPVQVWSQERSPWLINRTTTRRSTNPQKRKAELFWVHGDKLARKGQEFV